ncbi:MAG: TolC family protein [Gemmatimonadales bacterium]|nr:TolC family protein [Gemmatimonadales bacterium]
MRYVILTVALLGAPGSIRGQEPIRLGVAEAMARARTAHPQLSGPRAERRAREADARGSNAAYLPSVGAEWLLMRSDDPVAAFGAKLRQGIFSGADLGLDALNNPNAISNVSLGVTVEQPLLAPSGWMGRRAAKAGVAAARSAETRAEQLAALDALGAYYGAVLASSRVASLDTALAAMNETVRQVRTFRREGMVTIVDEQLATARLSELEAARAMAQAGRLEAVDRLLLLMGDDPGQTVELTDSLAITTLEPAMAPRADLEALRAVVDAQQANLARNRAELLPTAGAFGSLAFNDDKLAALTGPMRWTAGVVVRWSPFRGLRETAEIDRARAGRDRAREELAAAERSAQAEVRAAVARLEAATAALEATERALDQAAQAARVAATRYAGGAGTLSELLAIRAAESAQRQSRLEALYQARLAQAQVAVARGGNP